MAEGRPRRPEPGPPEPPAARRRTRARRGVRLGLRNRITMAFGFGAFLISSATAAITYYTTREQILSHVEASYATAFTSNAFQVKSEVPTVNPPVSGPTPEAARTALVDFLSTSIDGASNAASLSRSLIHFANQTGPRAWITDGLRYTQLPQSVRQRAIGTQISLGLPSVQVARIDGTPQVVFGTPIPAVGATFFQVFSLGPTADTLRIILAVDVGAAIAMTIAGIVIGRWASGRVLRPLREVSRVALAIASGRYDARLETGNLTDLAVLAASFNQMAERLQARIERDARFTSDVSHELRSPLTTLATALSVIEARRDELPERAAQALDLLAAEIRRFQRMVDSLLEISRADAGSVDLRMDVVAVGELLRRSLRSANALEVALDLPEELAARPIVVDKRRFERIVANLVENARRYAGGLARIVVWAEDPLLLLAFEDDGPGIPPEERERIFERFSRGSLAAGSRGTGTGTGLGLALVTEHVKLHGGRVWVEPSPSGGARFVVALPFGTESEIQASFEEGDAVADPEPAEKDADLPTTTRGAR